MQRNLRHNRSLPSIRNVKTHESSLTCLERDINEYKAIFNKKTHQNVAIASAEATNR